MSPRAIFLFGFCVTVLILIISELLPEETKVGALTFSSPDYRKWLSPDTVKYKDISAIIASVDTTDFQLELETQPVHEHSENAQTGSLDNDRRISSENNYAFGYPAGQDTLLFPFFRALNQMSHRNKPVRILHYGDSQIEADRITSTIRNHMHRNHGGQGIGLLPVVPVADVAITFQQNVSPHWRRFSILDRNSEELQINNRFGISGNFVRFLPYNSEDTVAHIGLLPYYGGYRNVQTFTHVRLLYGQTQRPFTAVINQVNTQVLTAHNMVSSAWWRFEVPQNSFDLLLASSDLPDLYGITLDGERGVAVDNLPLRGSAGLDFSRMDTAQMAQIFNMMDVEMLILQFGANVVTNFFGNPDFYANRFARQLHLLKSLKPGLIIIVVSANDMSQNTPDGYKSYPNIDKIRDAQRKAAFEAGCVFWDLYEAMGGENSMPSWATASPPLAQRDFVHFTVSGAKIVGELFCRAWTSEYQRFLNSR